MCLRSEPCESWRPWRLVGSRISDWGPQQREGLQARASWTLRAGQDMADASHRTRRIRTQGPEGFRLTRHFPGVSFPSPSSFRLALVPGTALPAVPPRCGMAAPGHTNLSQSLQFHRGGAEYAEKTSEVSCHDGPQQPRHPGTFPGGRVLSHPLEFVPPPRSLRLCGEMFALIPLPLSGVSVNRAA